MTLEDRIALAVQAVGAKFQRAYTYIGVLGSLNTEIKTDIVSAINNLLTLEGTIIIDKDGRIAALKNDLINGAASEYDTLQELYAAILANTSGLTSVLNDVANLVRYDAAQNLTDGQKTTARNNIGAVRTGSLGVIDRDYRAAFLGIIYPPLEVNFTTPGTFSYTVPLGKTSLTCHVRAGGGGHGGTFFYGNIHWVGSPGDTGAYSWLLIPVTAGEVLTIEVGAGGLNGGDGAAFWRNVQGGGGGGGSAVRRGAVSLVAARGGDGGQGGDDGQWGGGSDPQFPYTSGVETGSPGEGQNIGNVGCCGGAAGTPGSVQLLVHW